MNFKRRDVISGLVGSGAGFCLSRILPHYRDSTHDLNETLNVFEDVKSVRVAVLIPSSDTRFQRGVDPEFNLEIRTPEPGWPSVEQAIIVALKTPQSNLNARYGPMLGVLGNVFLLSEGDIPIYHAQFNILDYAITLRGVAETRYEIEPDRFESAYALCGRLWHQRNVSAWQSLIQWLRVHEVSRIAKTVETLESTPKNNEWERHSIAMALKELRD